MPTPNYFFRNYAIGRTHTGMLAYLCDLYNNDKQQPLRKVLAELGFTGIDKLPDLIEVKFEFKQADLGLFDGDHCFVLIEMKVDDREGWKQARQDDVLDFSNGWYEGLREIIKGQSYRQNVLYHHRVHQHNRWAANAEKQGRKKREKYNGNFEAGAAPKVLLVTLGVGEYGIMKVDPKDENPATHIGLKQWTSAFAKTAFLKDEICNQYVAALEQETAARKQVVARFGLRDAGEKEIQVRSTLHPVLWRMAHVVEGVKAPSNWPVKQAFHTIVKTAGGGDPMVEMPTTEDSFENMPAPLYMELKQSGYLYLKMFGVDLDLASQQSLYDRTHTAVEHLAQMYDGGVRIKSEKETLSKVSNTRTISKFDVGLYKAIHIKRDLSLEEVQSRISAAMGFYVEILNRL